MACAIKTEHAWIKILHERRSAGRAHMLGAAQDPIFVHGSTSEADVIGLKRRNIDRKRMKFIEDAGEHCLRATQRVNHGMPWRRRMVERPSHL